MNIIEKIEQQTEKFLDLRQEIESIIEALNELPAWAQSIDDAKARAKKLFNFFHEVDGMILSVDRLQELFEDNEQVLDELQEIKNYLGSWLVSLHITFNNNKP
jgi:DNA repair exonuclease SbcCD ATPase subunit